YGKSVTLSVSGPVPEAEPEAAPIGGGGGALASRRAGAGVGAVDAEALATVGSSLSSGRGSAGDRGGRLLSGNPTESRCGGSSRAGRSRAGRSRAGSRRGSSAGVGLGIGASSTLGGSETPRGEPTAAILGVRTTETGFDRVSLQMDAP